MNIYTLTGRGDEVGETRWRRQGGGDVEEEIKGESDDPETHHQGVTEGQLHGTGEGELIAPAVLARRRLLTNCMRIAM
jgi:hypothetical protein